MQTKTLSWAKETGWKQESKKEFINEDANLVIYFGAQNTLDDEKRYNELRSFFPKAEILGCTTGGEILYDEALDKSIVASAISFDNVELKACSLEIHNNSESLACGKEIAHKLAKDDLKSIFVISDGLNVNGSDLVKGITENVGKDVIVTGGLAGDGADFETTKIGLNCPAQSKGVAAVGFYGNNINVACASLGGWSSFGPEREITKSANNILYELDNQPALDLYKKYLGEKANDLPSSGLLFPLSIRPKDESKHEIVRTIVGIDEDAKSLIFAGDLPEGYIAKLMKGSFDNLIDGAAEAAENALKDLGEYEGSPLAILVSCIGRNLLLGQRISDETESVKDVLGDDIENIGFYSYGEICPHQETKKCGLHNQTMTITIFAESKAS